MSHPTRTPGDDPAQVNLVGLTRWGFAFPGPLRDWLTELALAGTKTASASLLAEYHAEGEPVPEAGQISVLVDSDERPIAIVEMTSIRVCRLADVDDQHAIDEGEGYASAAEFRAAHDRFWNGYLEDLRAQLDDPDFRIDDDTLVVLERFRVRQRIGPDAG